MHLNLDFVVLVCVIYCDAFERIIIKAKFHRNLHELLSIDSGPN